MYSRYRDGDVLGQVLPLPKHDPPRPADALAELVTGRRYAQYVREAEVEVTRGGLTGHLLEGGDEPSAVRVT